MEPTTGIEPVNLFLTKEALYLLSYVGATMPSANRDGAYSHLKATWRHIRAGAGDVERETRFELATSSLEGWSSTN